MSFKEILKEKTEYVKKIKDFHREKHAERLFDLMVNKMAKGKNYFNTTCFETMRLDSYHECVTVRYTSNEDLEYLKTRLEEMSDKCVTCRIEHIFYPEIKCFLKDDCR